MDIDEIERRICQNEITIHQVFTLMRQHIKPHPEENVNIEDAHVSVPLDFLQAVGHIGVDFGYGVYELEPHWIELARRHYNDYQAQPTTGK